MTVFFAAAVEWVVTLFVILFCVAAAGTAALVLIGYLTSQRNPPSSLNRKAGMGEQCRITSP
jgi:hypothetical protein